MASLWRKIITLLVTLLLVLQIIHLIMLNKLESRHISKTRQPQLLPAPKNYEKSLSNMPLEDTDPEQEDDWTNEMISAMDVLLKHSVLDTSGHYKIAKFVASATQYTRFIPRYLSSKPFEDITLVSQCSLAKLYHLIALSHRWKGPISVAVFPTGSDLNQSLQEIISLRYCHPLVRQFVSFHLIYPLTSSSLTVNSIHPPSLLPCSHFEDPMNSHTQQSNGTQMSNYALKLPYPNNLLRNEARKAVFTTYVLVLDIDMLPSQQLRLNFLHFARQNKLFDSGSDQQTVYVIPAFEMRQGQHVPANKNELLAQIAVQDARPFYAELCWKCQSQTDYPAWQKEPWANKLRVLFEVLWKDPWEPFYISRNDVPFYDERFQQYGFNRISQLCEVHVAGYKFAVLNDAFLVHQGFKRAAGFHAHKDADLERNRVLYRQFKQDLKERYADASRRCY